MGLTCSLDGDGDGDWYYQMGDKHTMLSTKRSRKCCSCKTRIAIGESSLKFFCGRPPKNDIEYRIYGDDCMAAPMTTKFMCEKCGDIAMNLSELGYLTPPAMT